MPMLGRENEFGLASGLGILNVTQSVSVFIFVVEALASLDLTYCYSVLNTCLVYLMPSIELLPY